MEVTEDDVAEQQTASTDAKTRTVEELRAAIDELNHWCAALPDGDGVGKLRGKLGRLEASLSEFRANGNLTAFKADLQSAEDFVRRLHALDPLTKLLHRLSTLKEQIAGR